MFKKIKSAFAAKNKTSELSIHCENQTDASEKEVDGFVLVGSTLSEREASQQSKCHYYLDKPPSYHTVVNRTSKMGNSDSKAPQAKNNQTSDSDCELIDPGSETSQQSNKINTTNPESNQRVTNQSLCGNSSSDANSADSVNVSSHLNSHMVYQDIPFHLGASFSGTSSGTSGGSGFSVHHSQLNMNDFNYEFNLEKAVIKSYKDYYGSKNK